MKLDDIQTAKVREWIDQGLKVAEVQTRLSAEFGLTLTYMEARFLLDDLRLRPKDPPPAPVAPPTALTASGPNPAAAAASARPGAGPGPASSLKTVPADESALGGSVSVTVDQIARPGALVSGKVTFRDGHEAQWQLDQSGRLGVIPGKPGYKPSPADVAEFQAQLETVLMRLGY
ncbi:MAG: hypothetical protein IT580_18740 [Verrucomicrobiales bacterium]|nr:hypothetical protein [Verrucomicrobiales bacterium]